MAHKEVYISDHSSSVLQSHSLRTASNSAAYLLASIRPHMQILDIGCGPGTITVDLAALVPEGHVTGIDSGAEALDSARSIAIERGLTNVKFEVGDALALAYPDRSFDVVHAHQVLQHLKDPVQALREMRRVTKSGGFVACREADFGSTAFYPESKLISKFQKTYTEIARSRGGEPDGGRHLVAWARKVGIDRSAINTTASVWCFTTPDERAYLSKMWVDRLKTSSLADNFLHSGQVTQEDLESFVEAWEDWGAQEDGWWTLTHGEILCRV